MEKRSTRSKEKSDLVGVLRKSWYRLRLSVRHPSRVPTWDAIVLTAASPEQAQLYHWQLRRAKRMGKIAGSTVTLAVPDPDGKRIGSGAATLNAIHALARHYWDLGLDLSPRVLLQFMLLLFYSPRVPFFSLLQLKGSVTCSIIDIVTEN